MCFWSSLLNLISKDTYMLFYVSCIISRFKGEKTMEQPKQFCSNLLTLRMGYNINQYHHLTNLNAVITVNVSDSQFSSEIASKGIA